MSKISKVVLIGIDGADPVFIRRLANLGKLPNIQKIMNTGFFCRALPSYSAKTAQNWTTIATGAEPGRHGITDLHVQFPEKPLSYYWKELKCAINGFDSRISKTEFLWNTAENNGKSVIVFNYACATPSTLKKISGSAAVPQVVRISPLIHHDC